MTAQEAKSAVDAARKAAKKAFNECLAKPTEYRPSHVVDALVAYRKALATALTNEVQ